MLEEIINEEINQRSRSPSQKLNLKLRKMQLIDQELPESSTAKVVSRYEQPEPIEEEELAPQNESVTIDPSSPGRSTGPTAGGFA